VSADWEFHASDRVARFLAGLTARDEARLLEIFERMARHPLLRPDDLPRIDAKRRRAWLRFSDGFAIIFWIDHAQKEVRVTDVGFE
jgi:hypothetical protein